MAARFQLVSFKTCPWVQRAAIVLREKAIDYDAVYIDSDNRPDWFLAISPHSKVPVLRIDDAHSLFESNAIAEYLDEVTAPPLSPADPLARARNRAWTDYIATFAGAASGCAWAADEADFAARQARLATPFQRLEEALERREKKGPFFNGADFSLVDAAYAPFLQRYGFIDRVRPLGVIEDYPRLAAWRDALVAHPSVRTATVPEIETLYRDNWRRRKLWIAAFLDDAAPVAA
jgi:glutathione S-transferase